MNKLRTNWISKKAQTGEIELCVGGVLVDERCDTLRNQSLTIFSERLATKVLQYGEPGAERKHCSRSCSILNGSFIIFLLLQSKTVGCICACSRTKKGGEEADKTRKDHFNKCGAGHVLIFYPNSAMVQPRKISFWMAPSRGKIEVREGVGFQGVVGLVRVGLPFGTRRGAWMRGFLLSRGGRG